jgi:hypothetical protein
MSAFLSGCPLRPKRFLVHVSVRGRVEHRAVVRLEGLGQLKIQRPRRESNPLPSYLLYNVPRRSFTGISLSL